MALLLDCNSFCNYTQRTRAHTISHVYKREWRVYSYIMLYYIQNLYYRYTHTHTAIKCYNKHILQLCIKRKLIRLTHPFFHFICLLNSSLCLLASLYTMCVCMCVRVYLLYGQNDVLKVWILMENNNNLLSFGLRCGDSVAFLSVVP